MRSKQSRHAHRYTVIVLPGRELMPWPPFETNYHIEHEGRTYHLVANSRREAQREAMRQWLSERGTYGHVFTTDNVDRKQAREERKLARFKAKYGMEE